MSCGGSRYGAGRPASHAKTRHYLLLDVRDLHRKRLLTPAASFSWQWCRDGEQFAIIGVRVVRVVAGLAVHLDYQRDHKPEHVELYLQRTACHYGCTRLWFTCPRCGRRVAIVYLAPGNPGCRQCLRLRYQSQSNDFIDRSWGRTQKIMRALGQRLQDFPRRPKGMREATYDRLRAAWWREDDFRNDAIERFMAQHADLLR